MGLLSKKRRVPRIVKKVKTHLGRRQVSIKQVDPRLRKHWDQHKSVQENFEQIGLKVITNPSLKASREGKAELINAQKHFKRDDEKDKDSQLESEDEPINPLELEESDTEFVDLPVKKGVEVKPDLAKVLGLKNADEVKFEDTVKKLNGDEVSMMRQLIAKYGDNFKAMQRDIKINFMQYSKGQLKSKYRSYFHFKHDKKK